MRTPREPYLRTTGTHKCACVGCEVLVRKTLLACPDDWWRLPNDIRHEITVTFGTRARKPMEHIRAVGKASRWWRSQAAHPFNGEAACMLCGLEPAAAVHQSNTEIVKLVNTKDAP